MTPTAKVPNFTNLVQLMQYFSDESVCLEHLKQMRWKDGMYCPHCGNEKIYNFSDGKRFKCATCRKQFTAKVGSIFEDTKISLQKWFVAVYLLSSHKKGISSLQLSKDLGVTQKTAWFMLHRLRTASKSKAFNAPLQNTVECDETYIGGKEKNKHANKRTAGTQGRSLETKSAVLAVVERKGTIKAQKTNAVDGKAIGKFLTDNVVLGSKLMTDEYRIYNSVRWLYNHNFVKHGAGEYVVNDCHTNTLERFSQVNTKDLSEIDEVEEPIGNKATPFLKWVGGKRSIIQELKNRLPNEFGNYYEAFVGGGALFFEIAQDIKKAHLSDTNIDLVITYSVIKKEPKKLIELLKIHQQKHSDEYYYKIRAKHNIEDAVEIAARMIYLNKTCFNGLFRVNKKGEFNVPVGKYVNPGICQEDNIMACHKALRHVTIEYKDYTNIKPQAGDFVYFDPPYHPTDETSFTAYSKLGFSEKDQSDLADFCTELHKQGVKVMISNSNTKFIRDLYKSNIFNIGIVNAPRLVNCKPGGRNAVEEVLITNY